MFLNCHSFFSLKYGTLSVRKLLETARSQGMDRLALTDINSTSGHLEFMKDAATFGVTAVLGVDFRNRSKQLYIGLAQTEKGLTALNRFLSEQLAAAAGRDPCFPVRAPRLDDVLFVYPLDLSAESPAGAALRADEFIGIRHDQIASLTRRKARLSGFKLERFVALQAVTFRVKKDYNAYRLLRAIAGNTLLTKLDPREVACPDEYMLYSLHF